ncbi:MAG: 4-hydroxythreonine-4-phosphate dehydrogenase PdxA [Planctomycetaceae bacterium]|nr:4-hydroxythreonine-4-phosphate dehydrogenase PdxA [Planctomycetaceae bacterium]
MTKPRLALTMGDVAGIGPEILVRALTTGRLSEFCEPMVIGHPAILERTARQLNLSLRVVAVDDPKQQVSDGIACWNPSDDAVLSVTTGKIQAAAGRAAYEYLVAAARAALVDEIDAICTAPLHKEALRLAGLDYPGHTEILAAECGVDDVAMMLYLPAGNAIRGPSGLGVAHVTLHTSIRSVPDLLSVDRIRETIVLLDGFLKRLGVKPRIGVCALNPHAGEHGLFGNEEAEFIEPAVQVCRRRGLKVDGPIPADALLRRAVAGEFDGVVAMYHDQGHIALKLIGFDMAVNVTLGLPIVRTSPSHGTAFDIAGQGRASADGFIAAAKVACQLALSRNVK